MQPWTELWSQAGNAQTFITQAQVQSWACPCGIYGGQHSTVTSLSLSTQCSHIIPCSILIFQIPTTNTTQSSHLALSLNRHVSILTSGPNSQSIAVLQLWSTDKFRKVTPHTNYVCVTVGDQIITSEEHVVPTTISMTHTKQQTVCATSHRHWINSLLTECLIHNVVSWSSVPLAQRVSLLF